MLFTCDFDEPDAQEVFLGMDTHSVRKVEATYPTGIRWPRYKSGDDATVAFCQWWPGKQAGGLTSAADTNRRTRAHSGTPFAR
ncbi:hypothetical protein [Streptomyces kaempferi]|uniref:hypothetical protein n=1 Tax=Streptomyces kaempferi TaxID=333725 RepID=UPI0036D3449C